MPLRFTVQSLDKLFREYLYYRLNVVELNLPALAKRKDDIIPLAQHFMTNTHQLSHKTAQLLTQQPWPGNVRELENQCQRAMVLCCGQTLLPEHFMLEGQTNISGDIRAIMSSLSD